MTVCECGHCGREQGTSPLSMPRDVALWTLEVALRPYLSRVHARLRLQDGRETGAERKHQILRETWQIWSGDFRNVMTCVWKWCHESCDVFRVARVLQERQYITRRRRQVMATFHELNAQKCGNNSAACAWGSSENNKGHYCNRQCVIRNSADNSHVWFEHALHCRKVRAQGPDPRTERPLCFC
jgi:hypothetical protein